MTAHTKQITPGTGRSNTQKLKIEQKRPQKGLVEFTITYNEVRQAKLLYLKRSSSAVGEENEILVVLPSTMISVSVEGTRKKYAFRHSSITIGSTYPSSKARSISGLSPASNFTYARTRNPCTSDTFSSNRSSRSWRRARHSLLTSGHRLPIFSMLVIALICEETA